MLLYVVTILSVWIVYAIVAGIVPNGVQQPELHAQHLSWLSVIAVCAVNPLFEETLVVGYIVTATSRHGAAFAITASALIRFLYHTYQGPIAAVFILPLGLIFAAVYVRWRELWPLIVAHIIADLLTDVNLAVWRARREPLPR